MSSALTIDTNDKIVENGVGLVNRHQLSSWQDRELQRYIDANSYLLNLKDRENTAINGGTASAADPFSKLNTNSLSKFNGGTGSSHYSTVSGRLRDGTDPSNGYNTLDKYFTTTNSIKFHKGGVPTEVLSEGTYYQSTYPGSTVSAVSAPSPVYRRPGSFVGSPSQISPSITCGRDFDKWGLTQTFDSDSYYHNGEGGAPGSFSTYGGLGNLQKASSGSLQSLNFVGNAGEPVNGEVYGRARTASYHRDSPAPVNPRSNLFNGQSVSHDNLTNLNNLPSNFSSNNFNNNVTSNTTSSVTRSRGRPPLPGYDTSLKRKEVSWSDLVPSRSQQRARSLSPPPAQKPIEMSQYGSASNLNRAGNQSPAYSSLGHPTDNYNRFETQRHLVQRQEKNRPAEEAKFGGFGDRVGSGVELAPHKWQGGEIIYDPSQLPRGPKPRRIYYSPIGDGTVAADGVELKKLPPDLTPKVSVYHQRTVERGSPGHGGVNIYEKQWSTGLDGSELGSGRNSRAGPISPGFPRDDGLGAGRGGPGGLGSGAGAGNGSPSGLGGDGGRGGLAGPGGPGGDLPNDGRTSVASTTLTEPTMRTTIETRTGYLITNPRELIHQYATTTPTNVMEVGDNLPSSTTRYTKKTYHREQTEEFVPYAPYRSGAGAQGAGAVPTPNKFVRQLRDENLTTTQREANTHLDPLTRRDGEAAQRLHQIQTQTLTSSTRSGHSDIDDLTTRLVQGLQNYNAKGY